RRVRLRQLQVRRRRTITPVGQQWHPLCLRPPDEWRHYLYFSFLRTASQSLAATASAGMPILVAQTVATVCAFVPICKNLSKNMLGLRVAPRHEGTDPA